MAAGLGEGAKAALREAARESFVRGLHVTLVASAVLLLVGAGIALRLPRRAAESTERAEADGEPAPGAGTAGAGRGSGEPAPASSGR